MAVRVRVGDAEIAALVDRHHPLDPPWHYPDVPAEAWRPYREADPDPAAWELQFRAFVVHAEGRWILIDTGWGPDFAPPGAPAGPALLLEELAEVGCAVDDVDLVVFTHLHADHVGWNLVTEDGRTRPRFGNARYLVPRADWELYSTLDEMHPTIRQNALPLAGLGVLDLLEPGAAVAPFLTSYPTPGHTPGHTSFVLRAGDDACVIMGDLAHHPVIVREPDFVHRFDRDPVGAIATRRRELARFAASGERIAAGHFAGSGFGRVRADGDGFRWEPHGPD
jgi:glyoxylase-like metal-dependent hydrolase (beta-lactamase superfamily II)